MKTTLAFGFNTFLWLLTQYLQIKAADIVKFLWSLEPNRFNWLIDSSRSWSVDSYLRFQKDLLCCCWEAMQDYDIWFFIHLQKLCTIEQFEQTSELDSISESVEDFEVVQLFQARRRNINSHHNREERVDLKCFSLQESFQMSQFRYTHEKFLFNQQLPKQF